MEWMDHEDDESSEKNRVVVALRKVCDYHPEWCWEQGTNKLREEIIVVNKGFVVARAKTQDEDWKETIYVLNITPSNSFASCSSSLNASSI